MVKYGILTLYDVLFQRTFTKTPTENTSLKTTIRQGKTLKISNLSSSRFTRRY